MLQNFEPESTDYKVQKKIDPNVEKTIIEDQPCLYPSKHEVKERLAFLCSILNCKFKIYEHACIFFRVYKLPNIMESM